MNDVVAVCAHRHRELHLVLTDLFGIQTRLRGHDVIERREPKSSARRKVDAEILRVAIGRAEQPENNLRLEQSLLIFAPAKSLPLSKSQISRMPGPPSDSYLREGGTDRAWQQSSCGRRKRRPSLVRVRSKRSIDKTRLPAKSTICDLATGRPSAADKLKAEVLVLDTV